MQQKSLKFEKNNNEEITTNTQIFDSKDEMKKSLTHLCYGDLYVLGRLWIEALKKVLVGANMNIFPVVEAAKPDPTPKCPPPMKYKDLPLYTSPHYEYKVYQEDQQKCPKHNVPILQEYLLPTVKSYRSDTQKSLCQIKCGFANAWVQLKSEMADHDRNFKKFMRDPNRLAMRQGIVAFGLISGYYMASKRGIPSRIVGTTLGGLFAGAMCFPKETDELFRGMLYSGGKFAIGVYNRVFGGDIALRERLACRDDLPPIPPPRKRTCVKK
ncbi:uncharacterized protein LOC123703947 [Colias croceus]|uniref:uncharacterized protein LOC123703947 n=1 Tax=Colias crocea TaxID=72248 RepID=UPI001E27D8E9|nr:uncharacterized protein LOC123703947 [Colias croceus]